MASIFLGVCAAWRDGLVSLLWVSVTVLGIFAIEVAKNASGEVFDFESGADLGIEEADRSPFSGGKRVLVDGLLTKPQTWGVALTGYAVGLGAGIVIVLLREPSVLWLGMAGVAVAFFYHAPPLKLSYRGLGEIGVGLAYGPFICGGTYLVQRGSLPLEIVLLSIPLGLLISAFLWINEFPDCTADQAAGKRNLVVRLGRRRASRWFAGILIAAFGLLAAAVAFGLPPWVLLGGMALVPAIQAAWIVLRHPETTSAIIPAQAATLLAFLLMAFGSGVGVLL